MNIEDVDSLEDVEHCVIYYNQAVLLYHLKQYGAALKIMHKIFSFIEPMGKKLKESLVYSNVLVVDLLVDKLVTELTKSHSKIVSIVHL